MKDTAYIHAFEQKLANILLEAIGENATYDGQLLASQDIEDYWHSIAPEYMADAVPQVAQYPTVSVAWACYLGMAVAHGWDTDWDITSKLPYSFYYGCCGFDDMDERITGEILGFDVGGTDCSRLENHVRTLATAAVSAIRHEQIPPQSETAFHVFAATCSVLYKIGASMELKRLGYKLEKVGIK